LAATGGGGGGWGCSSGVDDSGEPKCSFRSDSEGKEGGLLTEWSCIRAAGGDLGLLSMEKEKK